MMQFVEANIILVVFLATLLGVSLLRLKPDLEDILLGTVVYRKESHPYLAVLFAAGCVQNIIPYYQLVFSYYWRFYASNLSVEVMDVVIWPLYQALLLLLPLCVLILWDGASPKARDWLIIGLALDFYLIGPSGSLGDAFLAVSGYGLLEHLRHNLPGTP